MLVVETALPLVAVTKLGTSVLMLTALYCRSRSKPASVGVEPAAAVFERWTAMVLTPARQRTCIELLSVVEVDKSLAS